ncbi:hypothetical protein SERLADRAFT_454537 [Serpula lacrymans var. lacrymans S7.9]|nr:uncharacterized protein SERLADRAFT_454537 [Serpula lacrymans var. lacrymans S7.9]EGO30219.1 hypothetical protein SERLADRAFT_454537 [Serpula lacrymans var. lacrymans S7.9]
MRGLTWYTTRAVQDMQTFWFGTQTARGAREIGGSWVRSLEIHFKHSFGECHSVIPELTCLLLTGNSSDDLGAFLASAEQLGERGIQKWESSVADSLMKIHEYSVKIIMPALQRAYILLEDVRGYSQLPQYAIFDLDTDEVSGCLNLIKQIVLLVKWLAAIAHRELYQFKQFLSFLRYEASVNIPSHHPRVPDFDTVEVNNYLMSALSHSELDEWFTGPLSNSILQDFGDVSRLSSSLVKTQRVLQGTVSISKQGTRRLPLDRNLNHLLHGLVVQSQRIFSRASTAIGRSAIVSQAKPKGQQEERHATSTTDSTLIRQYVAEHDHGTMSGNFSQYLAIHVVLDVDSFLCLIRMPYVKDNNDTPIFVEVALLNCYTIEGSCQLHSNFNLLDVEFFDDECLVLAYQTRESRGSTFVGMVQYHNLGFRALEFITVANTTSRNDLVTHVLQRWREGNLSSLPMPIRSHRQLVSRGPVSLAVNGRLGRRVVCVLDGKGLIMEVFDMEEENHQ